MNIGSPKLNLFKDLKIVEDKKYIYANRGLIVLTNKWNCHTYHVGDFRVAQARPWIVSQSDHVLVIPWKANIIHYPALSRNTYMVFLFLIEPT